MEIRTWKSKPLISLRYILYIACKLGLSFTSYLSSKNCFTRGSYGTRRSTSTILNPGALVRFAHMVKRFITAVRLPAAFYPLPGN